MTETSTLETSRISARKSLGQHFLVDRGALRRVVEAADIQPTDVVVEVGPGTGLLTRLLAERAARVIAVEMDQVLTARLREDMGGFSNLTVLHGDAREWDPATVGEPYKMVANLPYFAASPIVRRFLESSPAPRLMVVTVQREVALSMVAAPGKDADALRGNTAIRQAVHCGVHTAGVVSSAPQGYVRHSQDGGLRETGVVAGQRGRLLPGGKGRVQQR